MKRKSSVFPRNVSEATASTRQGRQSKAWEHRKHLQSIGSVQMFLGVWPSKMVKQ